MTIIKGWTPPLGLGWGKWIELYEHTGIVGFKVTFDSESRAKSTFEIEMLEGGKSMSKKLIDPITTSFISKNCCCKTRVRFKSHTFGQIIIIKVKN